MRSFYFNRWTSAVIAFLLLFCIFSTVFFSCQPDTKERGFILRIRLRDDVDCLHPIISQSAIATQIEALIMLPMIEYSADKLELSPLLVKNTPELVGSTDSTNMYRCELLEEAKWDDGTSISAYDYAFTVKAALNPYVRNPSWRSFLKNISNIQIDTQNSRILEVQVKKEYMLGKEVSGNVNLYPEHVYDPEGIMRTFRIGDLIHKDSLAWTPEERSALMRFADAFQSAEACKSGIQGAGPYKLASWEAGSRIVLEKKQNWWAKDKSQGNKMLEAYPDRIEYLIMPDEAATILALKEGSIDFASGISPLQFNALRMDSNYTKKLQFLTTGFFQYALLELNTRKDVLSDVHVRRALAYLTDVNSYIRDLMLGMADPIVGPIHPIKPYFNKDLKPIPFNPDSAKALLAAAGWKDSDKDGILDKQLQGKKQKLSLKFLTSGELSKKIALLMQAEAQKVGIELLPENKETSLYMKDLNERSFDIAATIIAQQATSLYDPFQSYHSTSAKPGGGNRSGIQSSSLDSTIIEIRSAANSDARYNAYYQFQKKLYDLQPQIFLFSPQERLIARSGIMVEPIMRRPGYLENSFRKARN